MNESCDFPNTARALFPNTHFSLYFKPPLSSVGLRALIHPSTSILSLTHGIAFRLPFFSTVALTIFFSSIVHSLFIQQPFLEHLTGARKLGFKARKLTKAWAFRWLQRVHSLLDRLPWVKWNDQGILETSTRSPIFLNHFLRLSHGCLCFPPGTVSAPSRHGWRSDFRSRRSTIVSFLWADFRFLWAHLPENVEGRYSDSNQDSRSFLKEPWNGLLTEYWEAAGGWSRPQE